jgi:membrane protease YdiL (CAAX protease family)
MLALFMYESHVRAIEYVGGLYAPYHGHFDKPRAWEAAAILLGLVLNSFAEEFAMRGYAMRRIAQFSRSFGQTLIVPALLFASYHFYSGLGHVIVVFGHGLVLGLAYWWTRRIWPTIIAHTLYNLALYARAYEFIT